MNTKFRFIFLAIYSVGICKFTTSSDDFETIKNHPGLKYVDQKDCGLSSADRIIGGKAAALGQYPWIANLGLTHEGRDVFICGGALLNRNIVISASHCLEKNITIVRLGEYDLLKEKDCNEFTCAPPVQNFKPKRIFKHSGFTMETIKNDIALFVLDRPAELNEFVNIICLPIKETFFKSSYYETGKAEVAGWGLMDFELKKASAILMRLSIDMLNKKRCDVEEYPQLDDSQICAGGTVGKDSCDGDSGGPLMKLESFPNSLPRYYLLGVVSFGVERCGESNTPGVYSKIVKFFTWILDHIAEAEGHNN